MQEWKEEIKKEGQQEGKKGLHDRKEKLIKQGFKKEQKRGK